MNIFERFPLQGKNETFRVAIAYPHDTESLETIRDAMKEGIITESILVGDKEIILSICRDHNIILPDVTFLHADSKEEAAKLTAKLVHEGRADSPMKGLLDTSVFLKAMLSHEFNIREKRLLSHVMLMHREQDNMVMIATDGGMNIAPNLTEKVQIIENAVYLSEALGMMNPVVVPLTAKEKVYDKMPATVDADLLHQMNLSGELKRCRVSGPLQFDLAVSKESAQMKGCTDPLAGEAEIFMVPNIEAGNIFVKALTYLGGFDGYGMIVGSRVPMILVSRSDGEKEKMGSVYLARLLHERGLEHV